MALNMARISVGSARRPAPEDATRELEYLKQLASMHHTQQETYVGCDMASESVICCSTMLNTKSGIPVTLYVSLNVTSR